MRTTAVKAEERNGPNAEYVNTGDKVFSWQ